MPFDVTEINIMERKQPHNKFNEFLSHKHISHFHHTLCRP